MMRLYDTNQLREMKISPQKTNLEKISIWQRKSKYFARENW